MCTQPARKPERMYIYNHPMRCLDFFESKGGFLLFKQVCLRSRDAVNPRRAPFDLRMCPRNVMIVSMHFMKNDVDLFLFGG